MNCKLVHTEVSHLMLNGTQLAEGLKDRLLSYMTSALPVGNHDSQRFLGQRFYGAWQEGLFKGPFFETIPPYERIESLARQFSNPDVGGSDRLFAERFKPKYSWADVDPWRDGYATGSGAQARTRPT